MLHVRGANTLDGIYSRDAVVIDDVGPSCWNGVDAGSEWLSYVTGAYGKFTTAKFTPAREPTEIQLNGANGYVVIAGSGAFTFTLRDVSGKMKNYESNLDANVQ